MENQSANAFARVAITASRHPTYLVAATAVIVGAGLYLNWAAIVALGFAPLILAMAPCALMCAFGLCGTMGSKHKGDGKPPSQEDLS